MDHYVKLLQAGGLLAIPTETVYGLGADATNPKAIAEIYRLKGRPDFNPLIVHCHSIDQLEEFAELNPTAYKLAIKFWPGALTLVLPLKENHHITKAVTAGLNTVAVRIPDHPLTLNLLKQLNRPIAAPSANLSGKISPTSPAHIRRSWPENCPEILDGGACSIGLESTIIGFNIDDKPILLRAGGISIEALEYVAGEIQSSVNSADIAAPGQLSSHYAPNCAVVLNSKSPSSDDGYLAFGKNVPKNTKIIYQLSKSGDLFEAAANLFDGLHFLDGYDLQSIHVAPIPNSSIGQAINDRLARAAADRDVVI